MKTLNLTIRLNVLKIKLMLLIEIFSKWRTFGSHSDDTFELSVHWGRKGWLCLCNMCGGVCHECSIRSLITILAALLLLVVLVVTVSGCDAVDYDY